ncbi:MAG: SUMF1/EgtB/PvdO family nonheme iron enzyme [Bacteroidales bacterium]|nr:SUMF1/EgtB/PvdO family nonheme iron enzyme [Bacteroidales bacterium]
MKKLFFILAVSAALFYGCGSSNRGELVGINDRPYFEDIDLKGMVFINQGNYTMGAGVQNVTYGDATTTQPRKMQIASFFMDETEITNNEYRQFVDAVRDSLARRILGEAGVDGYLIEEDEYGEPLDPPMLNHKTKINYKDADVRQALIDGGYYLVDINHRRVLDVSKLNYEYYYIDYTHVAQKENGVAAKSEHRGTSFAVRPKGLNNRSSQIQREYINIYPDTLCWVHDYAYSMNEDFARSYFSSPAYDNYPVVGVSWRQAKAFCVWRSLMLNQYLESIDYTTLNDFRLPTESEWEFAARGGIASQSYPWGGPYVRNPNGCFLANYEPLKGAFDDDGGVKTLMVGHYAPNDYGLYDMAGNVSEWCLDAYNESTYQVANAMTPYYNYDAKDDDDLAMKRKVVRGGSWKDQKYFIQVQTRTYEFMDTAKCYIGFRCVQPYLGRVKGDNLRNASNVAR